MWPPNLLSISPFRGGVIWLRVSFLCSAAPSAHFATSQRKKNDDDFFFSAFGWGEREERREERGRKEGEEKEREEGKVEKPRSFCQKS